MFGALDISTSALVANRQRLEISAANLANKDAVTDANGNYAPYRRRIPIFATGDPSSGSEHGVHLQRIDFDKEPLRWIQVGPDHPLAEHADKNGNLGVPNVDSTTEMINALEASRSYEANITAAEATKSMMQASLRLLA